MRTLLRQRCRSLYNNKYQPTSSPSYIFQHQTNQHSRLKSTITAPFSHDQIYEEAFTNATQFDSHYNYTHQPQHIPSFVRQLQQPIRPTPLTTTQKLQSLAKAIAIHDFRNYIAPKSIPPYASNAVVPSSPHFVMIHDDDMIDRLRKAGGLARRALDHACDVAWAMDLSYPNIASKDSGTDSDAGTGADNIITTNDVNDQIHNYLIENEAYPSPLNYHGFPKSICSSVNEVICHGIPDGYTLRPGDVASFDISCFLGGVHGDNCATVLVGDYEDLEGADEEAGDETFLHHGALRHKSMRRKENFASKEEEALFISGRRLIQAAQESLEAGVATCKPGSCLSDIGSAISSVVEAYGYDSVQKYRGHGIGSDFHCPPFIKHYRNDDRLELQPGMVFTIEPMVTEGNEACLEWSSDGWTVVTKDGGRAAQFEHMVAITEDGCEILTLP